MSLPGIGQNKPKITLKSVGNKPASAASSSLRARAQSGVSNAQLEKTFTRPLGGERAQNSYGGWVSAQRNANPYDTQSIKAFRNDNLRAEANRYAGINTVMGYTTTMGGVSCGNDMDSFTKLMIGMQMGKVVGQSVFGILNATGVIGGKAPASREGALPVSLSLGATSTTLTGGLKGANSFSQVKNLESQAQQKKANLNSNYKQAEIKGAVDEKLSAEDVKAGLEIAGVNNIDTEALSLSELDAEDLNKSIETIDGDINNITNLQTTELPKAKAQVTGKLGEVGQAINAKTISLEQLKAQRGSENAPADLESQISQLESEIEELKQQEAQLKAAAKAIDDVISDCNDAINSLKKQKQEVEDLKDFEDTVKDKKYDLAKSQDEQLKNTMSQIEKLDKEISSLRDKNSGKANNADQKRLAKYNELISKRSGLYKTLGVLTQSLSSAGETKFENSKGKSYNIQNLDKAMSLGSEPPVEKPDESANSFASLDVNQLANSASIIGASNGNDAKIADASGKEYTVSMKRGDDGKHIYTIDGRAVDMQAYNNFIADKTLVS